jgi:hypothetical protein
LARSNYSYAKRQKELARQKKQEEKRLRKQHRHEPAGDGNPRKENPEDLKMIGPHVPGQDLRGNGREDDPGAL